MTKEEARTALRAKQEELRQAKISLEMHENGVREIKESIAKLEEFIDKSVRWQEELVKGGYVMILGPYGLYPFAYDLEGAKAEYTFKTEDQAQLLADKMNLMQEMHAFAHVKNEGWKPNWKDEYQTKWGISICENECRISNYHILNAFIFGIVVKSKEIADEMLEEFGERVAKIYNKQY